jgi:hypothetical protein
MDPRASEGDGSRGRGWCDYSLEDYIRQVGQSEAVL